MFQIWATDVLQCCTGFRGLTMLKLSAWSEVPLIAQLVSINPPLSILLSDGSFDQPIASVWSEPLLSHPCNNDNFLNALECLLEHAQISRMAMSCRTFSGLRSVMHQKPIMTCSGLAPPRYGLPVGHMLYACAQNVL